MSERYCLSFFFLRITCVCKKDQYAGHEEHQAYGYRNDEKTNEYCPPDTGIFLFLYGDRFVYVFLRDKESRQVKIDNISTALIFLALRHIFVVGGLYASDHTHNAGEAVTFDKSGF